MGPIVRELKSLPGAILGIVVLLMITFWVINILQTRAPSPVNGMFGWVFNHATGQAYTQSAAPAMSTVSPYSSNSNLGPMI